MASETSGTGRTLHPWNISARHYGAARHFIYRCRRAGSRRKSDCPRKRFGHPLEQAPPCAGFARPGSAADAERTGLGADQEKALEVLVSAVDRFGLATQLRAETNSAASEAEYTAALNALDALRRTSIDFLADGHAKIKVDHAVAEHLELGRQIVLFADQRRAARI